MSEPLQNFGVPRNNDTTITVAVLSDIPNDSLLGCTIKFCLYTQQFGIVTNDIPIFVKTSEAGQGITIPPSPPTLMEFDVQINQADTVSLDYLNYYYEATIWDEIGNKVCVIAGICAITVAENTQ